jgi:hypothetical protein
MPGARDASSSKLASPSTTCRIWLMTQASGSFGSPTPSATPQSPSGKWTTCSAGRSPLSTVRMTTAPRWQGKRPSSNGHGTTRWTSPEPGLDIPSILVRDPLRRDRKVIGTHTSPAPLSRPSPSSRAKPAVGDGDHDQDDAQPEPVASSTSDATGRDVAEHARVPLPPAGQPLRSRGLSLRVPGRRRYQRLPGPALGWSTTPGGSRRPATRRCRPGARRCRRPRAWSRQPTRPATTPEPAVSAPAGHRGNRVSSASGPGSL